LLLSTNRYTKKKLKDMEQEDASFWNLVFIKTHLFTCAKHYKVKEVLYNAVI
jgi:hypothetical protein